MKRGGGGRTALPIIIAALFVISSFVIFFNATDMDIDNDAAIGSTATVDITGKVESQIKSDIEGSCVGGGDVTIIGNVTLSDIDGLRLRIPNGAKVIWKATCEVRFLEVTGPGAFELHKDGSLTLYVLMVSGSSTGAGNTTVIINGNISFLGSSPTGVSGIRTSATGTVIVNSDITCSQGVNFGISNIDSTFTMNGNITLTSSTINQIDAKNSSMTINGNVTFAAGNYNYIWAQENGILTINGNVTFTSGQCNRLWAENGGKLTVNGAVATLDVNNCIFINNNIIPKNSHENTSSEPGFYEYKHDTSSVFVKALTDYTGSGKENGSGNGLGDDTLIVVAIAAAAIAAIGCVAYFVFIRKP